MFGSKRSDYASVYFQSSTRLIEHNAVTVIYRFLNVEIEKRNFNSSSSSSYTAAIIVIMIMIFVL